MVAVKIKEWKAPDNIEADDETSELLKNMKHIKTIWTLATDDTFQNVLVSSTTDIHLNYFTADVNIPEGVTYYLKATRIMDNGEEVDTSTIELTSKDSDRENVILQNDIYVDTPTVYVEEDDITLGNEITVTTSKFRSNGDYHAYTHWFILDSTNKVIFRSIFDKENLTSILINNEAQVYGRKSKLTFRAIHGTGVGIESMAGNTTVILDHANFEIISPMHNVQPYKDIVLKFKILDPNFRMGVNKVTVYDTSVNSPLQRELYILDNTLVIPWWFAKYGATLILEMDIIDKEDNPTTIYRRVTVGDYGYSYIIDKTKTYSKRITTYSMEESEKADFFYIPNNYYGEFLHNGLMPIPHLGDKYLHSYEMVDDKLHHVGIFKGIELDPNDTKENMLVKRIGDDKVLISKTMKDEDGNDIHRIEIYRYNLNSDKYSLYKKGILRDEVVGLGITGNCVQLDSSKIMYVPGYLDQLKLVDVDTMEVTTLSNNIPNITSIRKSQLEGEKPHIITPIILPLKDRRMWIAGGYTNGSVTYDKDTNKFQDSMYWEFSTFKNNRLGTVRLFNGDYLIYKKERYSYISNDIQNEINNEIENLEVPETLQAKIDRLNIELTENTEINVDVETIDVLAGDTIDIPLYGNLTENLENQYYVINNISQIIIEEKTYNKLKVRVAGTLNSGKAKITLIGSKDQVFDNNNEPTRDYTHRITRLDIFLNISRNSEETGLQEAGVKIGNYEVTETSRESECVYLMGDRHTYGGKDKVLTYYKNDPEYIIPFEVVNIDSKNIGLDINNNGTLGMKVYTQIITGSLILIKINGIVNFEDLSLSIVNKLRNATLLNINVKFVDPLVGNPPNKATVKRNNNVFHNGTNLVYTELSKYNITIPDVDEPRFLVNRTDMLEIEPTEDKGVYSLNLKERGVTYFVLAYKDLPSDICSNNIFFVSSVRNIPTLDLEEESDSSIIMFKTNTEQKGLITNDLTPYDVGNNSGYNIDVTQSAQSKLLLNIVREGTTFHFIPTASAGENNFKVTITNLDDGMSKSTTFKFKNVTEENYTVGTKVVFKDSITGLNNENIYTIPGKSLDYEIKTSIANIEFDTNVDLIDKEATKNDIGTNKTCRLIVKSNEDVCKGVMQWVFKNTRQNELLRISKNFITIPCVFYIADTFLGDVRVDNYEFVALKGELTEFILKPTIGEGYTISSIRLTSDEVYKDGVNYSIRKDSSSDNFKLRIRAPKDSSNTKDTIYKLRIFYTYTNTNGNQIITLENEHMQQITIKAVTYKQETYIKSVGRMKMDLNATKKLEFETNGRYVKLTPANPDILEVNQETRTVKALKVANSSVIVQSGSPTQKDSQEVIYIYVNEPLPEEEKPQGKAAVSPAVINVIRGNRANVTVKTNGDKYSCTTDHKEIAIWDDVTEQVIGIKPGDTHLSVTYSGEYIKGSTIKVPIKVLEVPKGDPDVIYFDTENNEMLKTEAVFKDYIPKSTIVNSNGDIIFATTDMVEVEVEENGFKRTETQRKTLYWKFY